MKPDAILIAGPTASGKSALAVRIARRVGGVVVNADALQVYDGLRILTARPHAGEMGGVEHHLYGHVSPTQSYSAAEWRRDVDQLLAALPAGRIPVFCGGTGLYVRALLEGLDPMPAVPSDVRERWRRLAETSPPAELHAELARRDPQAAARIRPTDPQRIVRALELVETTGRPLADLQQRGGTGAIDPERARRVVLTPDRAILRERIAQRFARMLDEGAMAEARDFRARFGRSAPLAEKAIGVRELLAADEGSSTLKQAVELAVTRSRQYAKRQETWFRHQFGEGWERHADPLDVPVG